MKFIVQSKGGTGKSTLVAQLVETNPNAEIIDMDNQSKTTSINLSHLKPRFISFQDNRSDHHHDRGILTYFFEEIEKSAKNNFICDLGPFLSDEIKYFFSELKGGFRDCLKEMGIEITFYVIIPGGNMFYPSIEFLRDLHYTIEKKFEIVVYENEFFPFNTNQKNTLAAYCHENQIRIRQLQNLSTENTQNPFTN